MATYAGRYSEDLQDRYGNAFRNALVAVQTLAGAAVTLYADRDKTAYVPASGLAANEIKADDKGNLRFFADPGNYQIVVTPTGGSAQTPIPVSVFPDPLEPDASQSEVDALEAAVTAEQSAREAGDTANATAIADEVTARGLADAALATADALETVARQNASLSLPPEDAIVTVHAIGDPHFSAITPTRSAGALAGILAPYFPKELPHVVMGDLTENGATAEDTAALAWLDNLDGPWYAAVGNHDMWTPRTGDAAAAAWGRTKNQDIDLGGARLIILSPDASAPNNTSIVLSQATLDYLDARLTAAGSTPCLICCHAPLFGTVGVGQAGEYSSAGGGFFVVAVDIANETNGVRDQPIRDILALHENAVAWISGHSHNPITTPALVTSVVCGTHSVACINASALYYTGTSPETTDPLNSLLISLFSERVEVRYLDHKMRTLTSPHGLDHDVIDLRKALAFTAASQQYIALGTFDFAFPDPNKLTIEFWFNKTANGRMSVLHGAQTGPQTLSIEVGGSSTQRALAAAVPGIFLAESSPTAPALGVNNHAAYVRWGTGAGDQAWYLNGVKVALSTATAYPSVVNASVARAIGRRETSLSQYWGGKLWDIRVWDHPRTGGQIRANMRKKLAGTESGLISQWRLDEGTGTTATDTGPGAHHGTLTNGPVWTGK